MSTLLFVLLFVGFEKPIEQKVTIHTHNHTHIQTTQHVHEHMHVENNLTLFYKLNSNEHDFFVKNSNFFNEEEFIPQSIEFSIFRPPIV